MSTTATISLSEQDADLLDAAVTRRNAGNPAERVTRSSIIRGLIRLHLAGPTTPTIRQRPAPAPAPAQGT